MLDTESDSAQDLPLAGLVVVDLSQFLSGPYCALRLSDLGARVIKVERPGAGDLSRRPYLSYTEIGGDSTIFHAINRGKESIALDLKVAGDLAALKGLLAQPDVVIQNLRPGVAARIGLDWPALQAINPRIVYGSISGYGTDGPWVGLPGQDLLAQARSGLMWLTGDADQGPVPMWLAVADMMAGVALSQGILAALVGRGVSGRGRLVETSLLEALADLQFEVMTWPDLLASEGFAGLDMLQTVTRDDGVSIETTRTPLTLDGRRPANGRAAPKVGDHSARIRKEFGP